VDNITVAAIDMGLLVLLGVQHSDTHAQAEWMAAKLLQLRVFADQDGKLNHNLVQVGGALIIVSQFTLYGNISHGTRPSFVQAANRDTARTLYQHCVDVCRQLYPGPSPSSFVQQGVFGATMDVQLVNSGPVTLIVERDTLSSSNITT
jgi:D-aminoacyl-tRNA deacylase